MKKFNTYIVEKLKKINSKNSNSISYKYFPEDTQELEQIIEDLIKERGNEADLNDIDTSKIKDMSHIFTYSDFNGDISNWDVSNVENMSRMFNGSKFNGDISKWDVSNVKDMSDMFGNSPLETNPPKWYKN